MIRMTLHVTTMETRTITPRRRGVVRATKGTPLTLDRHDDAEEDDDKDNYGDNDVKQV